jgi:hypothetical protein
MKNDIFIPGRTTLERKPIVFSEKNMVGPAGTYDSAKDARFSRKNVPFVISHVGLATRHGNIEARLDTRAELENPEQKCWFYVYLSYPWHRKTGEQDFDIILTDCETYILARRSLGESKFVLNKDTTAAINKAIVKFCEG